MPIKLTTTKDFAGTVNILVYGDSGIGKTMLCATADKPIIISAEAGLLSLKDYNIPVIEIKTREDCNEAYDWITMSKEAEQFDTICIDSLSEIAEVLLSTEKQAVKDPRAAYGVMDDEMSTLIRSFRDLVEKNVYFSAKLKKVIDDTSGAISYIPSVPGNSLLQKLPYFFDEVFAMRLGKLSDGTQYRYLQTVQDFQWLAKDRSGELDAVVQPNLSEVFGIIQSKMEKN